MMTYNRIKTEMTFQYSLPWDVCSCLLTSWLCFYNPQLPLNCRTSNCPSLISVHCSSLCCSDLFAIVGIQGVMLTLSRMCEHRAGLGEQSSWCVELGLCRGKHKGVWGETAVYNDNSPGSRSLCFFLLM